MTGVPVLLRHNRLRLALHELRPYLPPQGELVAFEDCGHFVHIEQPNEVAALVLDFLGTPA